MATPHPHGIFDPMYELGQRGVRVRLDAGAGGLVVLVEPRLREQRDAKAHARWVEAVLARYDRLIRLQLQLAVGLVPYRTVQWLLAHGYIEIRDKQFRLVKR